MRVPSFKSDLSFKVLKLVGIRPLLPRVKVEVPGFVENYCDFLLSLMGTATCDLDVD